MLKQIISTAAGTAIARTVGGVASGPAGMVIGAVLPRLARRIGPLGMIGVAVGMWAVRVAAERMAAEAAKSPAPAPQSTSGRSLTTS